MAIQEFRSGLEASASGGEGFGIQAFKPQRGPLKISANLKIPNLAKVLQRMGEHAEDFVQPVSGQEEQNQWRAWDASEIKAAEEAGRVANPVHEIVCLLPVSIFGS